MNMLIKNLNTSNIFIKYSKLYNYYKLYYNCEYIKLNGIIINIKINNYKRYNNLYYVYLNDPESIKNIYNIECLIMKNIPTNILRTENNKKYIICNSLYDINDKKEININISKLKYINNILVPIINII
mgnify:FL=1